VLQLEGARVVVQGFGSVGKHAARFLVERGAAIVAVADSRGATSNPDGLDLPALLEHKNSGQPVGTFPGGKPISPEQLVAHDCEIWIPAARPDVLTEDNAGSMKAKLILQGANIPATPKAEAILDERGVVIVPDFIANAGGVICAAVEFAGGSRGQAMETIADKIRENTQEVLRRRREQKLSPRQAALELARARVDEASRYRRRL
jgi:glutamate dehydrogenase (NAD(P)+)